MFNDTSPNGSGPFHKTGIESLLLNAPDKWQRLLASPLNLPNGSEVAGPLDSYRAARRCSEHLAEPLSPEDQMLQSMPDASPTKWHLAHTTWFFETFLLKVFLADYQPFDESFEYLFNSYYEHVGERHPRSHRGLLSRPSLATVHAYRAHVDTAIEGLLETVNQHPEHQRILELLTLGINHEQQHQELILTDIKHALYANATLPAYFSFSPAPGGRLQPVSAPESEELHWIAIPGGDYEIGVSNTTTQFAFDNEFPRHKQHINTFELANRLVTNREYLAFMEDGGYRQATLWLSDGWAKCQERNWCCPLYWIERDDGWTHFTLGGERPLNLDEPVTHVSCYEAMAFATWTGARLPTEAEWEIAAVTTNDKANFLDSGKLHPAPAPRDNRHVQMFGDVWEWTSSPYSPYPGFRVSPGAVGEYNGKFMINQMVLRGGSCVTPPGHIRASYRNFFYPDARWQFSGFRLARDL